MALLKEVKQHYGKLGFLINGEWVGPKSTNYAPVTNPANNEVIAELPSATDEEVNMAVEAAQRAFETWRNMPMRTRANMMFGLRAKVEEHFDELCRVLVQDHGRTMGEANGSVRRCCENIEAACSLMYSTLLGTHIDQLATGIDQYRVWEPMGAFLIIPPSNIPMHALSSFVPYALACGCTIVVSPSRQCPVASNAFIKVFQEAGFPAGVINLLHGGRTINKKILSHPYIKGVGFIGSSSAGRELFQQASNLGKVSSINGNGKNHVVIMSDAEDLNRAAGYLLRGCYGMTGQRCLGTDEVVIMGDNKRYEEVKSVFVKASKAMKLGYGLDESVELGPFTTQAGKDTVLNWIDMGLKEGAKMVLDGRNPKVDEPYKNGYFVAPTIMENVTTDMEIANIEAFGPVANLRRSDNLDEVIGWINATEGGHSAALVTSNKKNARKFIRGVDVGNVSINAGVAQPYAFFPMGSRRAAFYGMGKSRADSYRLFMDQKLVIERWI